MHFQFIKFVFIQIKKLPIKRGRNATYLTGLDWRRKAEGRDGDEFFACKNNGGNEEVIGGFK